MIYTVMFSGGLSKFYDYPRYKADIELFLESANRFAGFDTRTLTVLLSDGTVKLSASAGPVSIFSGTKALLLSTLSAIASTAVAGDTFIFYATNHGGPGPSATRKSVLWCWGEDQITSDDFASAMSPILAATQVFIFGQCYGGGFITSLTSLNRAIVTACQFDEVSYATTDETHDDFLFQFSTALTNLKLSSLREVFAAAVAGDTHPEHPQLDDPGGIADRSGLLHSLSSS